MTSLFDRFDLEGVRAGEPEADEVSRRIVDAAFAEIEIHGWQRVLMRDIAKRSGVGRATVYRRFATKEALLDALVTAELRKYLEHNAAVRAGLADIGDRIAASAAFAVGYLREHPLVKRMRETEPETLTLALNSDSLIAFARDFQARLWQHELHGDEPISGDRAQHLRTVAELHVRLTLSFVVNQNSVVPDATSDDIRRFAQRYLTALFEA